MNRLADVADDTRAHVVAELLSAQRAAWVYRDHVGALRLWEATVARAGALLVPASHLDHSPVYRKRVTAVAAIAMSTFATIVFATITVTAILSTAVLDAFNSVLLTTSSSLNTPPSGVFVTAGALLTLAAVTACAGALRWRLRLKGEQMRILFPGARNRMLRRQGFDTEQLATYARPLVHAGSLPASLLCGTQSPSLDWLWQQAKTSGIDDAQDTRDMLHVLAPHSGLSLDQLGALITALRTETSDRYQ